MNSRLIFLIVVILFISLACNPQEQNSKPESNINNMYTYSLSIANKEAFTDTSFFKFFFDALENTDYKTASKLLLDRKFLLSHLNSGYYILIPNKEVATAINYYLSYRFAESQGDVDKNRLRLLLVDAYGAMLKDSKYSEYLKFLIELENDYLKLYNEDDNRIDIFKLKEFKKYLNKVKKVGRVQYLWAIANYNAGLYKESFPWFYVLLSDKKYEKNIYNLFIDYYDKIGKDSVNYFRNLLLSKYPGFCNLRELSILAEGKDETKFMIEYKKCIGNEKINDSIQSNVLLASFYLNSGNIKQSEKLLRNYYAIDSNFSFDETQKWERRKYFDIYSKLLFIKANYSELTKFIIKQTGYNEIIKMENENDFKNYLKLIYDDVVKKDLKRKEFENFYKKNFSFSASIYLKQN